MRTIDQTKQQILNDLDPKITWLFNKSVKAILERSRGNISKEAQNILITDYDREASKLIAQALDTMVDAVIAEFRTFADEDEAKYGLYNRETHSAFMPEYPVVFKNDLLALCDQLKSKQSTPVEYVFENPSPTGITVVDSPVTIKVKPTTEEKPDTEGEE